jgi:predicted porin
MNSFDTRARSASLARLILRSGARCLIAAVASIAAGASAAADFSVGAGAGADWGRAECVASFPCDRDDAHWKLFAGYRIGGTVDVQAVIFDAGRFKGGDTTPLGTEFGGSFEVGGVGLTGGYRWELAPSWSLGGRAGLAAVRTRFDYADAAFGKAAKTTLQPLFGLGLAYAITPTVRLSLDYDVTRFKVHTTHGSLQMLGLAAQYSF